MMNGSDGIKILWVVMVLTTACSHDDHIIPASQLPESAKSYIAAQFPAQKIVKVEEEQDEYKIRYEVDLNNRVGLEFDAIGQCIKMDNVLVPLSALPHSAQVFLRDRFPHQSVIRIEKEMDRSVISYEVLLSNGIELTFDMGGHWLEIEDNTRVLLN